MNFKGTRYVQQYHSHGDVFVPTCKIYIMQRISMHGKKKQQKTKKHLVYGSGDVLLNTQSGVLWWPKAQLQARSQGGFGGFERTPPQGEKVQLCGSVVKVPATL